MEKTLLDLNLTYLDLFLIHSPFRSNIPIKQTWEAMEQLVDAGLGIQTYILQFITSGSQYQVIYSEIHWSVEF